MEFVLAWYNDAVGKRKEMKEPCTLLSTNFTIWLECSLSIFHIHRFSYKLSDLWLAIIVSQDYMGWFEGFECFEGWFDGVEANMFSWCTSSLRKNTRRHGNPYSNLSSAHKLILKDVWQFLFKTRFICISGIKKALQELSPLRRNIFDVLYR